MCVCVCMHVHHTAHEFTLQEVPEIQVFMNQGKSF